MMPKFSSFLVLVLTALLGFQTWQTWQLRQEVSGLAAAIKNAERAAEDRPLSKGELKDVGALLSEAARAASSGDLEAARQTASQAYALLESGQDSLNSERLMKELDKTREFIDRQLKNLYQPRESGKQSN